MADCADCKAVSYSVKGIDVNATLGTAEGMSTFEEIKSLGTSVCGTALRGAPLKGTALEGTALGAAALGGMALIGTSTDGLGGLCSAPVIEGQQGPCVVP